MWKVPRTWVPPESRAGGEETEGWDPKARERVWKTMSAESLGPCGHPGWLVACPVFGDNATHFWALGRETGGFLCTGKEAPCKLRQHEEAGRWLALQAEGTVFSSGDYAGWLVGQLVRRQQNEHLDQRQSVTVDAHERPVAYQSSPNDAGDAGDAVWAWVGSSRSGYFFIFFWVGCAPDLLAGTCYTNER